MTIDSVTSLYPMYMATYAGRTGGDPPHRVLLYVDFIYLNIGGKGRKPLICR